MNAVRIALILTLLTACGWVHADQDPAKSATPGTPNTTVGSASATPSTAKAPAAELSPAQQAVLGAAKSFTKAYNEGDAKAIAALFTEEAEILIDDNPPVKGRAAIQAVFEETFADSPGASIELSDTSVRFLADNLAIEEGTATITPAPSEDGEQAEPQRSRYTVHYLKTGDQWLQASVRDIPDREPSVTERLAELEWMIGEWVDEGQNGVVETYCDWDASGKYLIKEFVMRLDGEPAISGTERIGWDPLSKQIKSWMFDSEGGHGEALWTRSGDEWLLKAKGVLPDGRIASATRTLTFINKDMMRIQSTDRVAGGKTRPDRDVIVLVRKPPAPAEAPATDPKAGEPTPAKGSATPGESSKATPPKN